VKLLPLLLLLVLAAGDLNPELVPKITILSSKPYEARAVLISGSSILTTEGDRMNLVRIRGVFCSQWPELIPYYTPKRIKAELASTRGWCANGWTQRKGAWKPFSRIKAQLEKQTVTVAPRKWIHGRMSADIYLPSGESLAHSLIKAGACEWNWLREPEDIQLRDLESLARKRKLGLFRYHFAKKRLLELGM